MTPLKLWASAARPRTLPAAIVPVVVGVAVAHAEGRIVWWHAALALVVSLSMQIGTNYANDYSDGVRGTDDVRVGPTRLVAGGLVTPHAVRNAAIATFAVGAVCGLVLALVTSPWIIAVGAASIAAGWLYTGGPRPYGYFGFGELFVFIFFGVVAVVGTAYVSGGHVDALSFVASVPVGLSAVALLVINNLRDIPTDEVAGKKTLAVRIGTSRTRALYVACVVGAVTAAASAAAIRPVAAIALIAFAVTVRPIRVVLGGESGRGLIAVLAMTGLVQLCLGALLALGIAL